MSFPEDLKAFVAEQTWTYAKTMPKRKWYGVGRDIVLYEGPCGDSTAHASHSQLPARNRTLPPHQSPRTVLLGDRCAGECDYDWGGLCLPAEGLSPSVGIRLLPKLDVLAPSRYSSDERNGVGIVEVSQR